MDNIENLRKEDAARKIKELAMDAKVGLLTTNLSQLPLSVRPMATLDVDDAGNLWFMSRFDEKLRHIEEDNRVQLFYCNQSSSEYLSIYGQATVFKDRQKVEELWTPIAKTWFNEGKDDPQIHVIKVAPQDAYYWDTKTNKIVSLIKIAVGALTGNEFDDGRQGTLKV